MGALVLGKPVFMGHVTPKRYAASVLELAQMQGIYADSPEFAAARAKAEEVAANATSTAELYEVLDEALEAAGGKHSGFITPEKMGKYRAEEQSNPPAPSVDVSDGVAVATVPAISNEADGQAYARTLAQGLADALSSEQGAACGVVVDLRGNTGGDMGPMVGGLSPLLPDGTALTFQGRKQDTAVTITGNSVRGGGTPTDVSEYTSQKFHVPVAVLVDESTGSSGEATMLAFHGLENSRSFGRPTAGYASANISVDYPDGAQVLLTISRDKARTGEVFAEDPIQPDVQLGAAPADAARADPDQIPAAVRDWLAQQGCVQH